MTYQPFQFRRTATFTANPQEIMFTFDPVPQGLVWTGNIAFSVPHGSGPDLQGILWTAFRNGVPVLTWQEFGVACDLQAVAQEVITVVGVFMGASTNVPQFEIDATFSGFSDVAPGTPVAPWVAGSNRGLVNVYNAPGPGQPLAVSPEPQPAKVLRGRAFLGAASSSANLMTNTGSQVFKIWELGISASVGQLSTTAGAKFCTIGIAETSAGTTLLQTQLSSVPASADSTYMLLPMHGFELPSGETLTVSTGAYGGDNLAAVGHVVYSVA